MCIQVLRLQSFGCDFVPFEDILCQMFDLIRPRNRHYVTLGDLKRCKTTHLFFDTFTNLHKYMDREQRDPFANFRVCLRYIIILSLFLCFFLSQELDEDGCELTDWDRFAVEQYDMLVAEEAAQTGFYADDDALLTLEAT